MPRKPKPIWWLWFKHQWKETWRQPAGKRRRYGGAALSVVNEIFQPHAHSVQLIQEEKREARLAKPAPTDKPDSGSKPASGSKHESSSSAS